MIYVPPARFVSSSRVFVTPYMEGVRSVPAPLKGTESEGEGTVPQLPTRGIPVQGLNCVGQARIVFEVKGLLYEILKIVVSRNRVGSRTSA
jgi:hypothetical protein